MLDQQQSLSPPPHHLEHWQASLRIQRRQALLNQRAGLMEAAWESWSGSLRSTRRSGELLGPLNDRLSANCQARAGCSRASSGRRCGRCLGELFAHAEWKKARVHIDYHVEVDGHYYRVPYQLGQPAAKCPDASPATRPRPRPRLAVAERRALGSDDARRQRLREISEQAAARRQDCTTLPGPTAQPTACRRPDRWRRPAAGRLVPWPSARLPPWLP
jgi:hypothetical protein